MDFGVFPHIFLATTRYAFGVRTTWWDSQPWGTKWGFSGDRAAQSDRELRFLTALQRLKQVYFRPRRVLESDHQAFQPNWWVCPVTKTTSTTSPISWNLQGLPSLYGLRISVSQVMSSPCAKKEIECLTRNLVQLDKNWPIIFVWHKQIHKIAQPCLKKLWPHWGHCLPAALAGWHWEKASCEVRSEDVGIPSRQQVWCALLGAVVSPTCTLGTVFSQWFANMFWNA